MKVVEGFLAGTRGYLPNDTIGDVLWKNLNEVGTVRYTNEELQTMSELSANCTGNPDVKSFPELVYLKGGVDPYSQDDGEASWHIPLGRLNWEIPLQIPLHNWATTALAGMEFTKKGALMCSETICRTAMDLFDDPSIAETAEEERKERIGDAEVSPPAYDNYELLTKDPESFWDGTWLTGKLEKQ